MRQVLRRVGKSESRVAIVFGITRESCSRLVLHLRSGAPAVPIHLFSTVEPSPETSELCARVCVRGSALALLLEATRSCRHGWAAISAGVWNGTRRHWLMKWAPFLIPPFRVVLLNRHGDFLPGTARNILAHGRRNLRDAASRAVQGIGEARHAAGDRVRDLSDQALFWILWGTSVVLRTTGYPHRVWFARRRRFQQLHLPSRASSHDGIAVFHQAAKHWDGRALEQFARSTGARWILWQLRGAGHPAIHDLLPAFSDCDTFAASFQHNFRAWKPILLPTAAFRALQPGETAQVLAPVAPAILVDRQKLLALGVPRCHLPETAWMLCFWKAAAAGWRAYSVGQDAALREEPDQALPETEFLYRLLTDPALRRLAPAEPALSRGAVASAPAIRPLDGVRRSPLKVLLVSPFLPYPLSHGGAVRIYNLCRVLSARVDFTLIALREKDETVDYRRLKEIFREVYVVDIDERPSGDSELPEQVRRTQSQPLRALIREVAEQWRPDVLQFEYTHMAHFRECARHVPAILVEHDLTFTLYRQLAEEHPGEVARREYERWRNFERAWLAAYDGVWTVSPEDRRAAVAETGRPRESTYVVPNGVDIRRFTPSPDCGTLEILYVGSFRHLPNVIAFENLRREIMPRVWSRLADARLTVVAGKDYERYWSGPLDPRIELHGFVEDLRPLYARAPVVAAPLGPSAGTNIKVLEAMACGKALVSTATGCAGLGLRDGTDGLIRDDWNGFADALCSLLTDPPERIRLGTSARRAAEARFSWDAIAAEAYDSYRALSSVRTAPAAVNK